MISVTSGLIVLVVVAVHTGGVLWYADRSGYSVRPSEIEERPALLLSWICGGLILKAVVPVGLFVVDGLIAPLVLFVLGLALVLRDESRGSAGDALGVVYLNMWPAYVVVFLLAGGIEYLVRAGVVGL